MDVDTNEMIRDNRYISIQLYARGDRALTEQGLTGVQARVLMFILERSECGTSLTEIHNLTGYSMAATSGLIKRLREKGFVRVESCANDERRKLLFVTDKGRQVRDFMDSSMRALPQMLYRGFSDEELATLNRLQKKMIGNLSGPHNNSSMEESTL